MSMVTREVERACPTDQRRALARIDPTTMAALRIDPGDVVSITGASSTAVKAWRLPRQEWDRGIIRITDVVQANAGIDRFDDVVLQGVTPEPAKKVTVEPCINCESEADPLDERWLATSLTTEVVTVDDTVLAQNTYQRMTQAPVSELPRVTVTATDAERPVVITNETNLTYEAS